MGGQRPGEYSAYGGKKPCRNCACRGRDGAMAWRHGETRAGRRFSVHAGAGVLRPFGAGNSRGQKHHRLTLSLNLATKRKSGCGTARRAPPGQAVPRRAGYAAAAEFIRQLYRAALLAVYGGAESSRQAPPCLPRCSAWPGPHLQAELEKVSRLFRAAGSSGGWSPRSLLGSPQLLILTSPPPGWTRRSVPCAMVCSSCTTGLCWWPRMWCRT